MKIVSLAEIKGGLSDCLYHAISFYTVFIENFVNYKVIDSPKGTSRTLSHHWLVRMNCQKNEEV